MKARPDLVKQLVEKPFDSTQMHEGRVVGIVVEEYTAGAPRLEEQAAAGLPLWEVEDHPRVLRWDSFFTGYFFT